MSALTKFLIGGVLLAGIGNMIGSNAPIAADKPIAPPAAATETAPAPAATPLRRAPAEIDPMATAAYTRSQYPQTMAKFGSLIPELNADRRKAAKIAAADERCDRVSNAQVTSNSARSNRRYWVECANVTRFFFDERSLAAGAPASVQTFDEMVKEGLKDW